MASDLPPPGENVPVVDGFKCPPGLEPLSGDLSDVFVEKQNMFAFGTYHPQSQYDIITSAGVRIFHVAETSPVDLTNKGMSQSFTLNVINFESQVPLRVEGDPSACCSGVTMSIIHPDIPPDQGTRYVTQTSGSCCLGIPRYAVTNANKEVLVKIKSRKCSCSLVASATGEFRMTSPDGSRKLGTINKTFYDKITNSGSSQVTFEPEMDVLTKAAVILTTIMIDYDLFNRRHYAYRRGHQ